MGPSMAFIDGQAQPPLRGRGEAGSSLILALIFIVAVSLIVTGLANWALNDLHNTASFTSARTLQNAANGATQVAIQSIRYNPLLSTGQTLNASPPSYCWGNSAPSELPISNFNTTSIDGASQIAVWCSTAWNPSSANTRVVTFSTCLMTAGMDAATCASNPALQAVVTFDDYPPGGSAPNAGQCNTYCGTAMTVNDWVWAPVVPVVTSLSPSSGPITGSNTVTIAGSGFTSGSSVNFIEASGTPLAPDPSNTVLAGTNVNVNTSAQTITVGSPAITTGATYFVTVTTPGGSSSADGPVFSYQGITPAITGVSANHPCPCTSYGGTEVTIAGNGFYQGATVNFVQESGGTAVSPTMSLAASGVTVTTVNGTPVITAFTPFADTASGCGSGSPDTTYFVIVTTSPVGGAGGGSSAFGPVFNYTC